MNKIEIDINGFSQTYPERERERERKKERGGMGEESEKDIKEKTLVNRKTIRPTKINKQGHIGLDN